MAAHTPDASVRRRRSSSKRIQQQQAGGASASATKPDTASSNIATKGDAASSATVSNSNDDQRQRQHGGALPPVVLVMSIFLCSGILAVFALRDVLSTGRVVAGPWDEAMLTFTKSMGWYSDVKGWKSTQGGLSAISQITTDANNMGGFYIRKMAGVAALGVHLQKIVPVCLHTIEGSVWNHGHYHPLLWVALAGNVAIATFYGMYWDDLVMAGAQEMTQVIVSILALESFLILYYLLVSTSSSGAAQRRGPAIAMRAGKTPASVPCRILSKTVLMVTSFLALIAARDLFMPGHIFDFIPRDDIYLEWTNAFLHSPPPGSPEEHDQGLEAPLYIGDKFISQLMALHLLILCLYKFVSAVGIRLGSDGGGEIKCKMIWQGQAIANAMIFFLLRLFNSAATTASLDLRWHFMAFAYETFILGMYGFL